MKERKQLPNESAQHDDCPGCGRPIYFDNGAYVWRYRDTGTEACVTLQKGKEVK